MKCLRRGLVFFAACSFPAGAQLANPEYYSLYHSTSSSVGTQLINSDGTVLHSWSSTLSAPSASTAYLREDGLLLRSGQRGGVPSGFLPGSFGTLQLVDWGGAVVWEFDLQQQGELTLHHDMEPMPNGNILATVWDFLPANELADLGWQPVAGANGVWMERIIEIEPNLTDGSSEIVWSWELRNHLVQNVDESAPTFGDVSTSTGKVDLNFNRAITSGDYFHISGMDFNAERNEIVLSPNNIDELWVIDHSTTTEEAASSEGGDRGRGGELIYRWGNPAVYDHGGGPAAPKFLERSHDPRWLQSPETGELVLTVHNNDRVDSDPGDSDSQVLELDLPIDALGQYRVEPQSTFGPSEPKVRYEIDPNQPFFSTPFMGGAQVLANGNVMITLALTPELVEVDTNGIVVWRAEITGGGFIFKAQNYPIHYAGYGPSLTFDFDVWRAANFGGIESLDGDPEADPDADGRSNLMEYYLGSGPSELDPPFSLETSLSETESEQVLAFSYTRRANVPDVLGRFEFSRDLTTWGRELPSGPINEEVVADENSREAVSSKLFFATEDDRGFLRLLLEKAP